VDSENSGSSRFASFTIAVFAIIYCDQSSDFVTLASLDEAYGIVVQMWKMVIQFDVHIEKSDPRISYSVERISLADVQIS